MREALRGNEAAIYCDFVRTGGCWGLGMVVEVPQSGGGRSEIRSGKGTNRLTPTNQRHPPFHTRKWHPFVNFSETLTGNCG